ncbi:MAG: hypothetical protein Q9221_001518 [Calogaya cf. arnoldii]
MHGSRKRGVCNGTTEGANAYVGDDQNAVTAGYEIAAGDPYDETGEVDGRFDPLNSVKTMLEGMKSTKALKLDEINCMEDIISNTAKSVKDHPWVLCHNDFHSHNLFLQAAKTNYCTGELMAIDFEDCNLGDPMRDLA